MAGTDMVATSGGQLLQANNVSPSASIASALTPEQRFEILEYWRSVIKRRWLILGLGLASGIVAALVALALTPIYKSTVTVLIETSKGKILSIEDVYGMAANTQREHYQTQVEIIKSREVLDRAVRHLKLWNKPEFDGRVSRGGIIASLEGVLGLSVEKPAWTEDLLADVAVQRLMKNISVEPVRLSQLVKVSVESADRQLAADIANVLAEQYIESDRVAKFRISQDVSTFLQERLTSLRERLTSSERALQDYRERKGIISMGGSAQTMSSQQATGTTERLLNARARRLELEGSYQQAKVGGDLSSVPAVLRDSAVADAQRLVNELGKNLSETSESLGLEHPRVKQLEKQIEAANKNLAAARRTVVSALMRDYEAAKATEVALERALGSARTDVQTVNREEFELAVLERDVQTNRQLYDMFMSRAKETNLAGDVQANVARVVDAAVPVPQPVKPAKVQIIFVAVAIALVAGALASMLVDRLDNTVKGAEDAELRLRQPVLAAVPLVPGIERSKMSRIFLDDNHSHYAEAIRTARTGVLLSSLDAPNKVLLVTSSLPGEGKTTMALNLAHAHAQTKNTLLIDCDMRRSQASRNADLPPGAKGITNYVAGAALEECIFRPADSPLMVMPVGDLPPNPLELILSQKFKEALKTLSENFEMIIIDSPPVELVSDALVLAPMVTSVAFVVKAMSTPAPLVRKSIMRIQRAGGTILGTVVNDLDFEHARMYYGEYSAGSYNYGGYGYGGPALTYGGKTAKAAEKARKGKKATETQDEGGVA